MTEFSSFK